MSTQQGTQLDEIMNNKRSSGDGNNGSRAKSLRAAPRRVWEQRIWFGLITAGMLAVVLPTIGLFLLILINGIKQLSWAFLTQAPTNGGLGGGIAPAILGTFGLMLGTILFALPLGVLAAVFLTEYARPAWLVQIVRTAIINLAGVPSIVHGLFGSILFVLILGGFLDAAIPGTETVWQRRTLLWGALTLGILVLPVVITATEEALLSVPRSFREGSVGLGATKWQTISKVILPAALPGILTGGILAVGRAAGETAPILFTAAVSSTTRQGIPTPADPVLALPYHLFYAVTRLSGAPLQLQYGIALVLLLLVLMVNLGAFTLRSRLRRSRRY